MSNFLIAFANRTDTSTLSGGSWLSTLPLSNLKDRTQGAVARSTDDTNASTKFDVDFGAEKIVRTYALVNHNMGLDSKVRIRGSDIDVTLTATTYDSGWADVWPAVYNSLDLAWEAENFWGGQYTDEERQGFNWTYIISAPASFNARYNRVEIDDTLNPNNYVQIGRLFVGNAWQPTYNFAWGVSLAWEDPSAIEEAVSGAESYDIRTRYRVARFNTEWLSEDESMAFAYDIQRRVGTTGEVIFQYDTGDTTHSIRRQFCGRLRTLSNVEHPNLVSWSTAWEIKELL